MPIVLLVFAVMLIVVAYKNTQGDLFSALKSDVPGFAKWFVALAVVGGLGFVPGLRVPSRWLLALVLMVLFMGNYSKILSGIQNAASSASSSKSAQTDPATQYASNPRSVNITTAQVQGTSSSSGSSSSTASSTNPYDPGNVVKNYLSQSGVSQIYDAASAGFGGIA